jgi:MYXO-CTERM domain-containing protein
MNQYRSGHQKKAESAIVRAMKVAESRDPDLYYCTGVIFRNTDLSVALKNMEHYAKLMKHRNRSPKKKRILVTAFLDAMRAEKKRREKGLPPRYFADPESASFGEPPGSPGAQPNAINTSKEASKRLKAAEIKEKEDLKKKSALLTHLKKSEVKPEPVPGMMGADPEKAALELARTPQTPANPPSTSSPRVGVTVIALSVSGLVVLLLLSLLLARRRRRQDQS